MRDLDACLRRYTRRKSKPLKLARLDMFLLSNNLIYKVIIEARCAFAQLRPIPLLNCPYKMASGCIAKRLKTILDKIIEKDQTCFIKGRYIGEHIRMIYHIMHYSELHNIPGLFY